MTDSTSVDLTHASTPFVLVAGRFTVSLAPVRLSRAQVLPALRRFWIVFVLFSALPAWGATYPKYDPEERVAYYGGWAPSEAWADAGGLFIGQQPVASRTHRQLGHDWEFRRFMQGNAMPVLEPPVNRILEAVLNSRWGNEHLQIYLDTSPQDFINLLPRTSRIWGGSTKQTCRDDGTCSISTQAISYAADPVVKTGGAPLQGRAVCWRPDHPDSLFVNASAGKQPEDCTFAEPGTLFDPVSDIRDSFGVGDCSAEASCDSACIGSGFFSVDYSAGGVPAPHFYDFIQNRPVAAGGESCTADLERHYPQAEYLTHLQVESLALAAENLALAYAGMTSGASVAWLAEDRIAYGQRAAAIVYEFARVFPEWDQFKRFGDGGSAMVAEPGSRYVDRDNEVDDMAGFWSDRIHTGYGIQPTQLAIAYEILARDPDVWDPVQLIHGSDPREFIEDNLFKKAIRRSIRFDTHDVYGQPQYLMDNRSPYQIIGLLSMGAAIGAPEVVRYALWKTRQILTLELMHDGTWPEGPEYYKQVVSNLERALLSIAGARTAANPWPLAGSWQEVAGFTSAIAAATSASSSDVGADASELLARLEDSHDVLDTLCRPDNDYLVPTQDTSFSKACRTNPSNPNRPFSPIGSLHQRLRPFLLQGSARAIMARGDFVSAPDSRLRLDLGGEANWSHANLDRLSMLLWAQDAPLVYEWGSKDEPYTLNHNTVRIGGVDQASHYRPTDLDRDRKLNQWPGQILAWHPVPEEMQVVEIEDRFAYWERGGSRNDLSGIDTSRYRRTLFLVPLAGDRNLVFDIFDVATDAPHLYEWLAHGRPDRSAPGIQVHAIDSSGAETLLATESPDWTDWELDDVNLVPTPLRIELDYPQTDEEDPDLHLHLLGPQFVSVRGVNDDSNDQVFRLAVERPAETAARFIVLWEPIPEHGDALVQTARLLSPGDPEATGLEVLLRDGSRIALYDNPAREGVNFGDGSYIEGRFVGVRQFPGGTIDRLWMYEARHYEGGDGFRAWAYPRRTRSLSETAPTLDALWDPAFVTLGFEPVARTGVDPQWMVQLRTMTEMPTSTFVPPDCIRHSRWIPVSDVDSDLETLLEHRTSDFAFPGRGYVYDPAVPSIGDSYGPHITRKLCSSGSADWPMVPQIVWPERAILYGDGLGTPHWDSSRSNVPVAWAATEDDEWTVVPEPGLEALVVGILALAGIARRSPRSGARELLCVRVQRRRSGRRTVVTVGPPPPIRSSALATPTPTRPGTLPTRRRSRARPIDSDSPPASLALDRRHRLTKR